ncbi:DUF4279 domain-containing protein [Planococcus alpniumensis]|uniref:DUF4279 domain-containing protein n=1 Tax=Planococcus alpniumensis TaxID=2708345 RepID=UPI001B8DA3E7|nr:DUF4279 domain-containing protein [Planococcus sp. MSAK28401]
MAYFSIIGDQFPLEEITEELAIQPTETYLKEEILNEFTAPSSSEVRRRRETDWTLSTGYQKSYDINDQLKSLLISFEEKQQDLILLKEKYGLSYLFMIVIKIENNKKPAMYLEKDIIDFASKIEAEIHFDLYINS